MNARPAGPQVTPIISRPLNVSPVARVELPWQHWQLKAGVFLGSSRIGLLAVGVGTPNRGPGRETKTCAGIRNQRIDFELARNIRSTSSGELIAAMSGLFFNNSISVESPDLSTSSLGNCLV